MHTKTLLIFSIFILLISCKDNTENISEAEVYDFSDRRYEVMAGYDTNYQNPRPLLIVLHGAGSSAASMIQATNFNLIAGEEKFIIVYPDAFQGLWNFGEECGMAFPERPDDLHFIKYIIDEVIKNYNVDQKKIFITGYSMGGYFTYYLAEKLKGSITAIAPVAATMPRFISKYETPNKLSVLIILGTKDDSVNYEGTVGDCGKFSGMESIQYWASINGCASQAETTYMPDNGIDYLKIRIDNFVNCDHPYETKLISIEGGGHRWYMNDEINTSEIIFNFFQDKSL